MTTLQALRARVKRRLRATGLLVGAVGIIAFGGALVFEPAPALADGGNWCYDISLGYGDHCYSTWESDLNSILAYSEYSETWAWLYNQVGGGESKSGSCSPNSCSDYLYLNGGPGHGYQELLHWQTSGPNPDTFYGTWSSGP